MTSANWVTLAIAILGVLHGPLVQSLFSRNSKNSSGK